MPAGYVSTAGDPVTSTETVVPSNTVNLANPCDALYVGVSGNITGVMRDGTVQLFENVPVGVFPFGFIRINATGTTATKMVAGRNRTVVT